MMKLKQSAILLLLVCFQLSGIKAQGPSNTETEPVRTKITGQIVEEGTSAPLEFAAVSLLRSKDTSLVSGTITDEFGKFEIEALQGDYFLKIEYIAFQTRMIDPFTLERNQRNFDLGKITLSSNTQMLDEVEVIAEKSTFEIGLDKKVFNVGKDLANRGGNAGEILDNIPSVTVDIEGQVSLRGSSNVRILVDGKQSGLIGIGSTKGLQSLQANMIERVEVITNPSAKYDAEGMSGIINIILKKQQRSGINGSVDASLGTPDLAGFGGNINYRKSDLNFFGQYGFNYRANPGGGNIFQEYLNENGTSSFTDQNQDRQRSNKSHTFRGGFDWFLNDKNTITASGLYRFSRSDNNTLTVYNDLNSLRELELRTNRAELAIEEEPQVEWNINYKRTFDKKGRKLSLDMQYRDGSETQSSDFVESTFLPDGSATGFAPLTQRSNNDEGESSFLTSLDFEDKIGKDGKFETGFRASLRDINNKYLVEEFGDGEWERLANQSNNFIYNEDVYALYTTIGNKFNRFSVQGGLRWEYSDIRTYLADTDERNNRTYNNFFPSVFMGYELSTGNTLQASYSRRIRRPGFRWLNPFFSFADSRNIFSGNPNLDPEFTDSYELSFVKILEKGSISASTYYRHTKNVIQRIISIDDEGITYRRPENLLTSDSYGFEVTYNLELSKWWDINGSANFFRRITDGGNFGDEFSAKATSMTTRMTNMFKLSKAMQLQSRTNYRAPQNSPQGKRKSMFSQDIALSMDILQNNGTLNLTVSDLFNTRKWRYTTFTGSSILEGDFQWRSRQVTLAFNYRINQKKRRSRGSGGGYDGGGEMMF